MRGRADCEGRAWSRSTRGKMPWKPVRDRDKYAVAIHNFLQEAQFRIKLNVGDTVHIREELGDWYFGYTTENKAQRGIFPKAFVQIRESHIDKTGVTEVIIPRQPPIVQEITAVLREWGQIWKRLYVMHDKNFEKVKVLMYELIAYRSKILSETLPVDELKDLKQFVTAKIDTGNNILGLDLVVRDEQGNILNPDITSTVQLFRQHEQTTERIKRATVRSNRASTPARSIPQHSRVLYLSVRNLVFKMAEETEVLLVLYDPKEGKAISENYAFRWGKERVGRHLEQPNSLRVLFTDLGAKDLSREKIFLVAYVIRVGSMEAKEGGAAGEKDSRSSRFSTASNYSSGNANQNQKKAVAELLRRPFGVAAKDVTDILSGKLDVSEEEEHFMPILQCGEKDHLDGTLKKLLGLKEVGAKESKGQGLWCSLKVLQGDLRQAREDHPHLLVGGSVGGSAMVGMTAGVASGVGVGGGVAVARKMGFPEIILPGDVRNDLYLTLLSGEFSKGSKSTDKNVEVSVKVCNNHGKLLPNVIAMGGGMEPSNEYRSVIYYHEDKPRWLETVRVGIPLEEFYAAHLRFTFKHRSSNEAKDRSEKPFALAFVRLMQEDGTTLGDTVHDLVIYKIDHRKWEEEAAVYLSLPSTRKEMASRDGKEASHKPHAQGLAYSNKDSFAIATTVCSTKLTQNVDLLGLLKWWSNEGDLQKSLQAFMKVDGEEVVKFLQDVLDALFNILMKNSDSDLYDNLVFECLIYIIGLVSDRKYQHFQPVLDVYIQENFSATLAYNKLIVVLKYYVDNATFQESQDVLLKAMKCLQYLVKFIVRSRQLFSTLYEGKGQETFAESLRGLLQSLSGLMLHEADSTLTAQGACLKYLPSAVPDLLVVFDPRQLTLLLVELVSNVPAGRLAKQKMTTVNDLVHSRLFLFPDCRALLLPTVAEKVRELLQGSEEDRSSSVSIPLKDYSCFQKQPRQVKQGGSRSSVELRNKTKSVAKVAKVLGASKSKLHNHAGPPEEMGLCVKILSDVMEKLHRKDMGPTHADVECIMLSVLRTVIQSVAAMDLENPLLGNMVAVMVAIYRQMSPLHYQRYLEQFATRSDLLDFLMEIMTLFQNLVADSVYPPDWCEMVMLQNSVILKSLRHFSHTIRDRFTAPFEPGLWSSFFHCAIAFLTQKPLQLEAFSQNKRTRLLARYRDMRRETGFEIRSMWFNLGQHKIQFVPSLVGPFLEMTLIPETELRKATIPIFFDMMQCEYYSPRKSGDSYSDTKRDATHMKANFSEFENELIAQLDVLVEGGRGDDHYRSLFVEVVSGLCENHATLRDQGLRLVSTVSQLTERLLAYRAVLGEESRENRMSCTVNLLDFYREIGRQEMYIRYLDKLCKLHLEGDNFTEAAHALLLHSKLLKWSDQSLPLILRSNRFSQCQTHRDLKEALYYCILDYFDKGKMWESALSVCKELVTQYEEEMFDYAQLSQLLQRMAGFYDRIMKQIRPEPEYFRVAFYGRGFPAFLQNKVFVYRGREYERLSDFSSRTLNQFPNAELMNKLGQPSEEVMDSPRQYLQVNKVDPVMEEKSCFSGKAISGQVLRFYRVNQVNKFTFARPFRRALGDLDNEFASLWLERTTMTISQPLPGILQWFPVVSTQVTEVSPLQNAVETMEQANQQLRELIVAHRSDPTLPLNPLSLKLTGMVDPAVMGGIFNYEKAFFSEEFISSHPGDAVRVQQLKELIARQIPLLEVGLQVHRLKASEALRGLQLRMDECFAKLRAHVEAKYGKRTCDLKLDSQKSSTSPTRHSKPTLTRTVSSVEAPRISDASSISERTRVSSLTRAQVSSLTRSLASSFSNLNSPTTQRSHSSPLKTQGSFSSLSSRMTSPHPSTPTFPLSPTSLHTIPSSSQAAANSKSRKREKGTKGRKKEEARMSAGSTTSSITNTNSWARRSSETHWYTEKESNGPVIELSQQLTPERPLRSEVEREKRQSRPNSTHFLQAIKPASGSNTPSKSSSNRDSIATTDSTVSTTSEEDVPPPLPQKTRETMIGDNFRSLRTTDGEEPDYCNLPPMAGERNLDSMDAEEKIRYILNSGNITEKLLQTVPAEVEEEEEEKVPPKPPKKPPLRPPTDVLQ